MIVFKAKEDKTVDKKLQKMTGVISGKIIASTQKNAWNDERTMKIWIEKVWKSYSFIKMKKPTLLVLDDATSHKTQEVKEMISECDTLIAMIPGGLTRCIQPLDRSINKPFKDQLKRKYIDYLIDKNSDKVSREKLMEWVSEIWWDDSLITPIMIENSFKISGMIFFNIGITNNMD